MFQTDAEKTKKRSLASLQQLRLIAMKATDNFGSISLGRRQAALDARGCETCQCAVTAHSYLHEQK